MAAGLPHFSAGWARCWGRDTFISFKGLLLIPGLYKQAREIIIGFARALRHGLIPNLLNGGNNPRYNCRDAAWYFIKGIRDYIEITRDHEILQEDVDLLFLSDVQEEHLKLKEQGVKKVLKLYDVIQNIFQSHATGIDFREWDAGSDVDPVIEFEGFSIQLALDEMTGFIFGGNEKNCLTWMDKMGSSRKAGNIGTPATPRDGAPIELTALLKLSLEFVADMNAIKQYPYSGVRLPNKEGEFTFRQWVSYFTA